MSAQLELLFWSALAFTLLIRTGIYPPELLSTNVDFDWFYRRLGRAAAENAGRVAAGLWFAFADSVAGLGNRAIAAVRAHHAAGGIPARMTETSSMVFWTTVLLATYLLLSYL